MAADDTSRFIVAYANGDIEVRITRDLKRMGRMPYKSGRDKTEIASVS
jgi:ABC-type enterochelin transport system ATPase subunit